MRTKFLVASFLIGGCGLGTHSSKTASAPPMARGGATEPADPEMVTDPLANLRAQRDQILQSGDKIIVVSFFDNGHLGTPQHVYVFNDGQRGMIRILEYATQGGGESASTGASMPESIKSALTTSISRLPPSQKWGNDANAFFVSWKENGKWISRTYDRTKLSPEVLDFCDLVNIPRTWL